MFRIIALGVLMAVGNCRAVAPAMAAEARPPNIVFILADDK